MTFLIVAASLLLLAAWVAAFVTQPLLRPVSRRQPARVDVERLRRRVEALSTRFHPRSDQYPENLDRAAAYIRSELEGAGAPVSFQEYEWGGERYRNVIASFGAADGPRVVVGAHYDAVPETPGADDNASGVAGLLELADVFRVSPPRGRVDLVAYTLEEPPHFRAEEMGSARHAAWLRSQEVPLTAMISLECISYFRDEAGSQDYPAAVLGWLYPSSASFIAVVGRTSDIGLVRRVKRSMRSGSDLPVRSFNGPAVIPGVDFSDHLSYWAYDYPAVMITDTAFYRNSQYHDRGDTADRLDYRRMASAIEGIHAAIVDLTSRS